MRKFLNFKHIPLTSKSALHTFPLILALGIFLSACEPAKEPSDNQSADQQFDHYTENLFCKTVTGNTLTLHYTLAHPNEWDITDYPITLGDLSMPDDTSVAAANESILHVLDSFPDQELSTSRRLSKEILIDTLNTQNQYQQYPLYDEPLSPVGGLQTEIPILLAEYTFYDEQDVRDYLTLLVKLPDCLAQAAQYEAAKSQAGLFMPNFASETVIAQCQAMTTGAESHFLIQTFNSRLGNLALSEEQQETYRKKNKELIEQKILPAFIQLAGALLELQGSEKNNDGLCHLPLGKSYYEYLVYQSTGSAKTVPQLAQAIETRRLQDLTDASILLADNPNLPEQAAAAEDTLIATLNLSAAENKSVSQDSSELAASILDQLQERIQPEFPSLSNDIRITVKEVEPSLRSFLSPAFYLTVPIDADTDNVIYLNDDAEQDYLTLFTTLAHEGYPGHLLQTVYFNRHQTCMMRHLLSYPGYVEGWATYAEILSLQYAGLDTNLALFLQLEKSVILSLYCSADIGIHYEGWDLEQTKEFFSGYGIDNTDVIQEVYEYIVETPANYLKYYGGYLEIEELKTAAIQKYGDSFDIAAFHQALLTMGPAPFSILEKYFSDYYEAACSGTDKLTLANAFKGMDRFMHLPLKASDKSPACLRLCPLPQPS